VVFDLDGTLVDSVGAIAAIINDMRAERGQTRLNLNEVRPHVTSGGAAMADAMALNQRLSKEGIMLSDMQAILPIAMGFVQEKTGVDRLRDVLASIPGLGPLMTGG